MPRYLVHLMPDAVWPDVHGALVAAGFDRVEAPTPELPTVAIATAEDEARAEEVVRAATATPGVRLIEPDAWQTML